MSTVPLCTIASANYLALARVLVDSYRRHHPGADSYLCLVDHRQPGSYLDDGRWTRIVYADELGIPGFANMAFRYNLMELNTAVKPYFLAHLRDACGLGKVFFFDADILIYRRLAELESALAENSVVLTPHIVRPLDDWRSAVERQFLRGGVFNLGFLGLQLDEDTASFLDWWQDRLRRFCLHDMLEGLFFDQVWMNLTPCFLDRVAVMRSPAFNVAWWNLANRQIEDVDGQWVVDGEKLGFMHFSGIDPANPASFSRHQNVINLNRRPDLRSCLDTYLQLARVAGHEELQRVPYGYDRFAGSEIPVHETARTALQRLDPLARRWHDPFDLKTDDSFYRWLCEPIEFSTGRLTRASLYLWESRRDLVNAFPEVCGEDLPRFAGWLRGCGEGTRAGLHESFLASVEASPTAFRGRIPIPPKLDPYDAFLDRGTRAALESVDLQRPGEFAGWLNQPAIGATSEHPVLTYLALLVHGMRPDLQAAFPDPLGHHQVAFARWFVDDAPREIPMHDCLVAPVRRSLGQCLKTGSGVVSSAHEPPPPPAKPTDQTKRDQRDDRPGPGAGAPASPGAAKRVRGVNLAGYFDDLGGIGQNVRGSALALGRAGIPVCRIPLDQEHSWNTVDGRVHHPEGAPFDVSLIHANATEISAVLSTLPATQVGGVTVGYWAWELAHLPLAAARGFNNLTEVWTPSSFCARAIEPLSDIPVRWVAPCVREPKQPATGSSAFGFDETRFTFLLVFDLGSVVERKNPFAAVEAIRRLHASNELCVGLAMKILRAETNPLVLSELHRQASGLPITIDTGEAPQSVMDGLIASCDSILSLHRSEGHGLVLVEGMYLERPVVATGYGGVTDFLDDTTGYPVDFSLRRVGPGCEPYPPEAVWAEPDLENAVAQMRRLVTDSDGRRRRAANGRARVLELYGVEAAAARFARELERVAARSRP